MLWNVDIRHSIRDSVLRPTARPTVISVFRSAHRINLRSSVSKADLQRTFYREEPAWVVWRAAQISSNIGPGIGP
jgi:hypothetical protein